MGTVYRKLKDGRDLGWYVVFFDADGKRRHVASKQQTKAAVRVFLAEIEAKVRRGLVGVLEKKSVPTVANLAERWLALRSGPKAATRRRVARLCLARVLPSIGALRADKLTRAHAAMLVADLGQHFAATTVRVTLETLGAVLGAAVPTRRYGRIALPRACAAPCGRRAIAGRALAQGPPR